MVAFSSQAEGQRYLDEMLNNNAVLKGYLSSSVTFYTAALSSSDLGLEAEAALKELISAENGMIASLTGIEDSVESGSEAIKELCSKHRFIGYLKDELLKPAKVQDAKMRVIYCNDLIAMAFMRMHFGSLLSAFNHSWEKSPLAIGYNQYSFDMQLMYQYFMELKGKPTYIAGDYTAFDKHCHPQFQRVAYEIIGELSGASVGLCEYLYQHETQSVAQLGPYVFKKVANHMSGCFFTTALNCIVNDLYMRYCFDELCLIS